MKKENPAVKKKVNKVKSQEQNQRPKAAGAAKADGNKINPDTKLSKEEFQQAKTINRMQTERD
ncbi:MAG: hypothetical protein ABIN36_08085 [Ferruginibacter sp.]